MSSHTLCGSRWLLVLLTLLIFILKIALAAPVQHTIGDDNFEVDQFSHHDDDDFDVVRVKKPDDAQDLYAESNEKLLKQKPPAYIIDAYFDHNPNAGYLFPDSWQRINEWARKSYKPAQRTYEDIHVVLAYRAAHRTEDPQSKSTTIDLKDQTFYPGDRALKAWANANDVPRHQIIEAYLDHHPTLDKYPEYTAVRYWHREENAFEPLLHDEHRDLDALVAWRAEHKEDPYPSTAILEAREHNRRPPNNIISAYFDHHVDVRKFDIGAINDWAASQEYAPSEHGEYSNFHDLMAYRAEHPGKNHPTMKQLNAWRVSKINPAKSWSSYGRQAAGAAKYGLQEGMFRLGFGSHAGSVPGSSTASKPAPDSAFNAANPAAAFKKAPGL